MDIDEITQASKAIINAGAENPIVIVPSQTHVSKTKIGNLCGMDVYTHKQMPEDIDMMLLSQEELDRL